MFWDWNNQYLHIFFYTLLVDWLSKQKSTNGEEWEEQTLPGHSFTPKQLFWISWGQLWCSKYRDGSLKNTIKTDPHSPGAFRTIGTVSNNPDFAKDFNCPKGSPMNPKKKCTVW